MNGLPKIERKELGKAALDERMTQDYEFFVAVSTGILKARGFEGCGEISGCYDLEKGKMFIPDVEGWEVLTPFEKGISLAKKNGTLRYSLATRFTRNKKDYGVAVEARFTSLEGYQQRTSFLPVFRSLVGDLGVHTRETVHSIELDAFEGMGGHPSEIALDLGYIVQTPTSFGSVYMLGLKPIQDLARMVSEKLA